MRPKKPSPPADANQEISALIETLHRTGQRLEELTAGEVDTVADRDGRTFLLRHAQEQLRHSEAAKQAASEEALRRFAAAMDAIADAIYLVDRSNMRFVHVNDAACRMLNQTREELLALEPWAVLSTSRAEIERTYDAIIASGVPAKPQELLRPRQDGAQAWVEVRRHAQRSGERWTIITLVRDITERKRAEDALRQSKNLLQLVVENVPFRIFWKDRDLRYLGCNALFAKDAGRSMPEELTGKTDFDMGWKDQAELYRGDDKTVLESGGPKLDIEEPQTTPDGNTIWLRTSKVPLRDKDNQVIGILGLYQDITERKRGERLIRDSEKRFRTIFDQAPIGMALLDKQGRLILSNAPLSNILGYSNEELSAMTFDDFTYLEDVDKDRNQFTDLMAGKISTYHMEKRYVHKNGNLIWANLFVTVLRDENDLPQDIIGMVEDITERKHAEKHLVQMESRYRGLLEAAPDAMVVVNQGGEIVLLNVQAEKQFGYHRDELVGQKVKSIIPDGFAERLVADGLRSTAEALAQQIGTGIELTGRRKDGSDFPIEIMLSPLEGAEGILVTAAIRDISARKHAEKHLVQMEGRYRGLLEAAPDAMVVVNQIGEIVLLNLQAEKQFGYRRDKLVGQEVKNIIPEGFAERLVADGLRSTAEALAQQIGTGIELTGRRKDGSDFPIEIMLSPLESAEGILVTAAIRDITERKASENRIRRLNRVYAVLSGINTLIVRTRNRQELFDEACRITVEQGEFRLAWIGLLDANGLDVTPMARAGADAGYLDNIQFTIRDDAHDRCEILTRALREQSVVICNDIETDPQMARWREEALRRGYRSVVVLPLQFAEKVLGVLLLYAAEKDFFDIEEMKLLTELAGDIAFAVDHLEKQARLDYLAYYDVLTGLANRSLFLERLAQYTRSAGGGGHQLALYLIDLERFKNINDSLGRPAGDALLRQVAEWLTRSVGDAGLLARVGADVFAAVLPEVRQDGDLARFLEKRMDAFLEHPFRLNDAVFRIAAKVGIALCPDDGADAETLFRNAEAALKKAKASGQRYLFYTQTMTDAVAGRLSLENQLRQAIDNEEFVLHYQPKVHLLSGKMSGAEALIRWNDPRTGLVPPGRFIPILEETGMIYEVGRWAVRKAISDYLRWRAAGLPAVRIAVNVSPLQLRNAGFIDEIRQAISIDAQAPAGLELEITESVIMEDVKRTIASLQAIRAMGVSLAIDDFGTGFSSLSYLAKLPVDTLKIDRSFVIDMTVGPEGLGLVSTIINLAHALKLKVVAEGVETEEQSRLLRLLACDEMQGYLFSKPVPAEVFEIQFLRARSGG